MRLEVNSFNLNDLQRVAVTEAIRYTKGNVQYARELLNVSKGKMYRLLKVYGIDYNSIREENNRRALKGFKTKSGINE